MVMFDVIIDFHRKEHGVRMDTKDLSLILKNKTGGIFCIIVKRNCFPTSPQFFNILGTTGRKL